MRLDPVRHDDEGRTVSDDRRRDKRHRDGDPRRINTRRDEGHIGSADNRYLTPRSAPGDVYGPFRARADAGSEASVVYEEFSCEDALLATVRDCDRPDRWIQTTMVVPVEE